MAHGRGDALKLGNEFSVADFVEALRGLGKASSAAAPRHEVAVWWVHHREHSKLLADAWKSEILRRLPPARWPTLLYLIGDVVTVAAATPGARDVAADLIKILPRLLSTVLSSHRLSSSSATTEHAQALHRAVVQIIGRWSEDPHIPREWLLGLRRTLDAKVAADDMGWVADELSSVDRGWQAALLRKAQLEARLREARAGVDRARAARDGAAVGALRDLTARCLRTTEELEGQLTLLRDQLREQVLDPTERAQTLGLARYDDAQTEFGAARVRQQLQERGEEERKRRRLTAGTAGSSTMGGGTNGMFDSSSEDDESESAGQGVRFAIPDKARGPPFRRR